MDANQVKWPCNARIVDLGGRCPCRCADVDDRWAFLPLAVDGGSRRSTFRNPRLPAGKEIAAVGYCVHVCA